MKTPWNDILLKYSGGAELDAVVGGSRFTIVGADDDQIHFKGRLWVDTLSRERFEQAIDFLEGSPVDLTATGFLERFRMEIETDPTVAPGCSRLPNLATVVLRDLGYFNEDAR